MQIRKCRQIYDRTYTSTENKHTHEIPFKLLFNYYSFYYFVSIDIYKILLSFILFTLFSSKLISFLFATGLAQVFFS